MFRIRVLTFSLKSIGMDNMVVNLCFNARHYNTHQLREETGLPWKSHLKAYSSLSMFSRDMDAESFYTDQSHINQKVKLFSLAKTKWILWTVGMRSMVRILQFYNLLSFHWALPNFLTLFLWIYDGLCTLATSCRFSISTTVYRKFHGNYASFKIPCRLCPYFQKQFLF